MPYAGKKLAVKGDPSEMDPEFIEYYKGFVVRMLDPKNIQTKKIGSHLVTGTLLKAYIAKWREIFLSAVIPEAKTVHDAIAELQNTMAVQTAMKGYEQFIKDGMTESGLSDRYFEELHRRALDDSKNVFTNVKKLGSKEFKEKFHQLLDEKIILLYEKFKAINTANKVLYEAIQELEREKEMHQISSESAKKFRKEVEDLHKKEIERIKRKSKRIFPDIFKFIPVLNILHAIEDTLKDEL